jgi:hypothetical protein
MSVPRHRKERCSMIGLLRVLSCATLFWVSLFPALAQTAPPKPRSPGEIAAADRLVLTKRENCKREARALKLGYFERRRYIKECLKRP